MSVTEAIEPTPQTTALSSIRVAVATKGTGIVDQHFGHAKAFLIYEVKEGQTTLIEQRSIPQYCHGTDGEPGDLNPIIQLVSDCQAVLVAKIGANPAGRLQEAGIEAVQVYDKIETAVLDFHNQWITKRE
jgi:nitrogen fixation protein NifB